MQYFGVHSLDGIYLEQIKKEADSQGKKLSDLCSYDELFHLLLKVSENSKETVSHQLDNILF